MGLALHYTKRILLFFIAFQYPVSYAQDSIPLFNPNIRVTQTFTTLWDNGFDGYGYQISDNELQMHSRVYVHIMKHFGLGFNYTAIRYTSSYFDPEYYRMYGPLLQVYTPERYWRGHSGKNRSFAMNFEFGYYQSDYLPTAYRPIRKANHQLLFATEGNFFYTRPLFISFGMGSTFLLNHHYEAEDGIRFFYRLGLGWRIKLKSEKGQARMNTRSL